MELTVLGGGHGCHAAAAELAEKGHRVRFWRRDGQALEAIRKTGCIRLKDFRGERSVPIPLITDDLKAAVSGAELIVIPLPATTHDDLAVVLAPYLEEGQVIYLPPGTFGSFIFAKAVMDAGTGADVTVAETGTLPYLARLHAPDYVVVSGYGKRLPTGVFPARNSGHAWSVISRAYPAMEKCEDALSGALMNAGPIIHPPLIMMNAGPLEHFEQWDIHNEGTQPSIRRVTDALDSERIALREALGYGAPHFPLADHYASEGDEWMYGRGAHERLTDSGDWREHIVLTEHRYMVEDTAIGLSLMVSLGRWAEIPTPIAAGFLAIGSAIAGQDFYRSGRTLESLGLDNLSRNQMNRLLQEGFEA